MSSLLHSAPVDPDKLGHLFEETLIENKVRKPAKKNTARAGVPYLLYGLYLGSGALIMVAALSLLAPEQTSRLLHDPGQLWEWVQYSARSVREVFWP